MIKVMEASLRVVTNYRHRRSKIGRITVELSLPKTVGYTVMQKNTFESLKVTLCILNVFTECNSCWYANGHKERLFVLPDGSRGIKSHILGL